MKRSLALSSGQYRHCHKVSDQDEPVVQDVIMKIFKKIGKCDALTRLLVVKLNNQAFIPDLPVGKLNK